MLNLNDYKNKLAYPSKTDFMTTFYYRAGQVVAKVVGMPTPAAAAALKMETQGCVVEKVVDDLAFNQAREAYGRMEQQLVQAFKANLFADNGLKSNEFTEKLYAMAWEQGHANGYHEIESIFNDLADLDAIARKVYGK